MKEQGIVYTKINILQVFIILSVLTYNKLLQMFYCAIILYMEERMTFEKQEQSKRDCLRLRKSNLNISTANTNIILIHF